MKHMVVRHVMTHLVVTLRPQDPIHLAAEKLSRNEISGAPVTVDGKVVGIITESDVARLATAFARVERGSTVSRARAYDPSVAVADAMTRRVVTVEPDTSIWTASSIMDRRRINRLPVVDREGCLKGILTRADIVRAMGRLDEVIRTDVLDAIHVLGDDTLGDLQVEVVDGVVELTGTVDTLTTARIAVELASRIPGVAWVFDRLDFAMDDSQLTPTHRPPARLTSIQDHWFNRDWVPKNSPWSLN